MNMGKTLSEMKDFVNHLSINLGKEVSELKQELTEAEQNLSLADRNPKRVLNVKKLWKCNKWGGTL